MNDKEFNYFQITLKHRIKVFIYKAVILIAISVLTYGFFVNTEAFAKFQKKVFKEKETVSMNDTLR